MAAPPNQPPSRPDGLDDDQLEEMAGFFSLRKPKNAKAGLASGSKNFVKGVVAGAVNLVAAPVIGAQQEGLKGFAKGVGAGVVGAVVLPVTGAATGVAQVVRGIANQPEAAKATTEGKVWDQEQRQWVDQPTNALVVDDAVNERLREQWHQKQLDSNEPSVDYYVMLGVSKEATTDEVKKAYYVLARKYHPDKNPDDPLAKERFQKLGEAYQVLGNPESRSRYDKFGSQGMDVNFMDGAELFTMLFGSDRFAHLIGELMITMAARIGDDISADKIKRLQDARVDQLTINLVAILKRWVAGDTEGFTDAMAAEAEEMVEESFGRIILHTIGRIYTLQSAMYLGNFFEAQAAKMRQSGQAVKSHLNAANLAIKAMQRQQQMEIMQKEFERKQQQQQQQQQAATSAGGDGTAATDTEQGAASSSGRPLSAEEVQAQMEHMQRMAAMEEAAVPLMLDAMWAANVVDIENTLKRVCRNVLQDSTADKDVRKARAAALKELGRIFTAAEPKAGPVGGDKTSRNKEAREHIEEALRKMQAKREEEDEAMHGTSSGGTQQQSGS